ncbi:MAG: hypothetical protein M3O01_15550 [Pseudomonadota bacterium]|nr:hypothetical protein [Pseudomonadota bacterium]
MTDLELTPKRVGVSGATLTPEQKRFNTLIARLERARSHLADWHSAISAFRTTYVGQHLPLRMERDAALKRWLLALEGAAGKQRLSRSDQTTVSQTILVQTTQLLEQGDDPELKALFNRWSPVDYDADKAEGLRMLKDLAEAATGLDLGDVDDLTDEDDVYRKVHERAREAAAAPPRRKTGAQKRKEAERHEATLSVRDVFRKLASALHPDRESDPARREAKTALMQRANQAYGANDLLTLLELQLEIEHIDSAHLATADARRLKHYNRVLSDQIKELQLETDALIVGLAVEFDLHLDLAAGPRQLKAELARETAWIAAETARLQDQIRSFENPAQTKRLLKDLRRRAEALDAEFLDEQVR